MTDEAAERAAEYAKENCSEEFREFARIVYVDGYEDGASYGSKAERERVLKMAEETVSELYIIPGRPDVDRGRVLGYDQALQEFIINLKLKLSEGE